MPFCSQCGNQVGGSDIFCAKCGARQPIEPAPARDPFSGVTPRTASILCYIPLVGWVPAVVVLASERFRNNRAVRFHAFQGLYLFVAWLIVDQVIGPMFRMVPSVHVGGLLRALVIGVWIFMIVKTSHEETYSLPVIGELAERSVAER